MLDADPADRPILSIKSLGKSYPTPGSLRRSPVWAIRAVDLEVHKSETLGIVGESGSGKSTLGRTVAGLLDPDEGEVLLAGRSVHAGDLARRKWVWRRLQMIFQDPYSSLNPRMTVAEALLEPLGNFGIAKGGDALAKARKMLDACGLPARSLSLYPKEFSGGQRQRIGIARALITDPDIVIADEPVSALDVSVQAQILNLLSDLQKEFRLTYVFVGHDLAVVRHIANRVVVMKSGAVVEMGATEALYSDPQQAYTQQLLASSPIPEPRLARAQLYA